MSQRETTFPGEASQRPEMTRPGEASQLQPTVDDRRMSGAGHSEVSHDEAANFTDRRELLYDGGAMKPHPDCPDVGAWYRASYEIAADRNSRLEREATNANSRAAWAEECAIVALRLLKGAGKLKPRTDDERAVIAWAENLPALHIPGGNRRLANPMAAAGEHPDEREAYIARATDVAQTVLDLGGAA